ncbi:MAG TPA: TetR family transcriptional regulator [Solirubrobacteraceae bacterium]|nr:TetR family transcriptional regulator [Solirubrobacteraceae bacterium]
MSSVETPSTKLGLRERKKQQTREKIARVALELFAERGYDATTLADIAEAAEVAPRTIFAYYESKDDILLCQEVSFLGELKRRLDARPPGTTTVDTLREFVSSIEAPDESAKQRKQIMTANPALQKKMRATHADLEPMLAESIAKDLGAASDDIRPLLVAASMTAALTSVSDRIFAAAASGKPMTHEQAMGILDEVLDFLRGGLEALQAERGAVAR